MAHRPKISLPKTSLKTPMPTGKQIWPDYIRPNDILYWDAKQAGKNTFHDGYKTGHKNRPFLVDKIVNDTIICIPITHSKPNHKSIYRTYNVKASPSVSSAINELTNDHDNRPNYFRPLDRVKVKKSTFMHNQLPEKLGNLTEKIQRNAIRQQKRLFIQAKKEYIIANKQYHKEQKIDHHVKNYYKRSMNKEVLSDKEFVKFLASEDYNQKPKEPFTYQPLNHHNQPNAKKYSRKEKHKKQIADIDFD